MNNTASFRSVSEMLRQTAASEALVQEVERDAVERQFVKHLIAHRVKMNMSQKELAEALGCTQSRISKLENNKDAELRLGDIEAYAKAVGLQIRLVVAPKSHTVVDEIKYHAFKIKERLQRLVELAETDDQEIAEGVTRFVCIETPLYLIRLVVDAAKYLPRRTLESLPGLIVDDEAIEPFECNSERDEVDTEDLVSA